MSRTATVGRRAVTVAALGGVVGAVVAAVRSGHGGALQSASATSPSATNPSTTGLAPVSRAGVVAPAPTPRPAPTPSDLPRGGRTLFPRYRLVGFCGLPGAPALGPLGAGDLDTAVRALERVAAHYGGSVPVRGLDATGALAARRQVLPVLELIAVVVHPRPGADGLYRERIDPAVIDDFLAAARRHRALLLLNIQPGRARFLDEARALERWLLEPQVGLALDPEWAVAAPAVPGEVFGRTTGAELDRVSAYLDGLVRAHGLPQKALVVHQVAPRVVTGLGALRARPGVAVVKSVDGIGTPQAKVGTWSRLVDDLPSGARTGFKLFFTEDRRGGSPLMTSTEVLGLTPVPDYVMYE